MCFLSKVSLPAWMYNHKTKQMQTQAVYIVWTQTLYFVLTYLQIITSEITYGALLPKQTATSCFLQECKFTLERANCPPPLFSELLQSDMKEMLGSGVSVSELWGGKETSARKKERSSLWALVFLRVVKKPKRYVNTSVLVSSVVNLRETVWSRLDANWLSLYTKSISAQQLSQQTPGVCANSYIWVYFSVHCVKPVLPEDSNEIIKKINKKWWNKEK